MVQKGESAVVKYDLDFQMVTQVGVCVSVLFAAMSLPAFGAGALLVLLAGLAWLVGGNYVLAVVRFRRFLKRSLKEVGR